MVQLDTEVTEVCVLSRPDGGVFVVQVVKIEDSLHAVTHQNGRLKAELRDLQRERDFFKHDVAALTKQLQNAGDKVGRSPYFSRTPFWRRSSISPLTPPEPCFGEGLALGRPP